MSRPFRYAPQPRHTPERDPEWLSEGVEIGRVARLLGIRLMPWQEHCAEIATQYQVRKNSVGQEYRHYKYRIVLISVPRQSGKTTLLGPVRLHRMMTRPNLEAFSTAQTGKDAAKRMNVLIKQVMDSPLRALFKARKSNGAEGLTCIGNGSTLTRFSPVVGAIHGETPQWVDMDEIWKFSESLGDNLLGGILPSMITQGGVAQLWMISTKGTQLSDFMNKWLQVGVRGEDPDVCLLDWSMDPDMDIEDPRALWSFHPALGNTISEEDLVKEMFREGMTKGERLRAFGNIVTDSTEAVIDAAVWAAQAREPLEKPDIQDVVVAYDVAREGSCSSVVAAWRDVDGAPCIRVLHQAPGTRWLPGYVGMLHALGAKIAADDGGPARRITDELTRGQDETTENALDIRLLRLQEFSTACMSLLAAARENQDLKHDGSEALASAVAGATIKAVNGVERFSRDHSAAPIPSLVAAAVALYVVDHPEEEAALQIF